MIGSHSTVRGEDSKIISVNEAPAHILAGAFFVCGAGEKKGLIFSFRSAIMITN